jgi:mannose-6-phosphate isomerase-like protein (cupin superfamily)
MTATFQQETSRKTIQAGRQRYLTHTNDLMMVVLECTDWPCEQPDPPHHHPHEQITYVAEGEVLFFLGETSYHMKAGDMVAVPSNVPHAIQPLTSMVRLVDTFNPIREEFLKD